MLNPNDRNIVEESALLNIKLVKSSLQTALDLVEIAVRMYDDSNVLELIDESRFAMKRAALIIAQNALVSMPIEDLSEIISQSSGELVMIKNKLLKN